MALTVLDPIAALIIVDLQKGIVGPAGADRVAGVVKNARALADAFRQRNLPVVLVNVVGMSPGRVEQGRGMNPGQLPADFAELIPELNQQPQDHLVTKRARGAFSSTDLEEYLKARKVTQVVVIGISTSSGVESTARQAYELGFNVTLAVDAMLDSTPDGHNYSVTRIFPRLGETGTTQEVIDLLK